MRGESYDGSIALPAVQSHLEEWLPDEVQVVEGSSRARSGLGVLGLGGELLRRWSCVPEHDRAVRGNGG